MLSCPLPTRRTPERACVFCWFAAKRLGPRCSSRVPLLVGPELVRAAAGKLLGAAGECLPYRRTTDVLVDLVAARHGCGAEGVDRAVIANADLPSQAGDALPDAGHV